MLQAPLLLRHFRLREFLAVDHFQQLASRKAFLLLSFHLQSGKKISERGISDTFMIILNQIAHYEVDLNNEKSFL